MEYEAFLNRIIDDGVAAARRDYSDDLPKQIGAIQGFEACRGKGPVQLLALLEEAKGDAARAMRVPRTSASRDDYWRLRCFELEVGWVCNVISSALFSQGRPTIVEPTARGLCKAAEILGVAEARFS